MRALQRILAILIVLAIVIPLASYLLVPLGSTDATHFDTLIVLGYPTNPDGTPSPEETARVLGAVDEFKAGRAAHLIMTGGAAHNHFVEAEAMARVAEAAGVPASAIEIEGQAQNTIQNIFYSEKIMQAHGWKSAGVVSDRAHIVRAALILSHWGFLWKVHAAPWPPSYSFSDRCAHMFYEILAVNRVRWGGFPKTPFLPSSH
jgi:uncharacterized SAM-binding protein YcdF (DUF218 family)